MKYLGKFKDLIENNRLFKDDLYLIHYVSATERFVGIAKLGEKYIKYNEYSLIPYFVMHRTYKSFNISCSKYDGNTSTGSRFTDNDEIFSLTNEDLDNLIMDII